MNSELLKRILLEACVLIAFGALVGLTINYQLVLDAFAGRLVSTAVETQEVATGELLPMPVLLDEVAQVLENGGLAVDARNSDSYAEGHIAGAVSLPLAELDENELAAFIQQTPKTRILIVYCSGFGCPDSFDLGILLLEQGYADVRVFEGGYPEWRDAGYLVGGGVE